MNIFDFAKLVCTKKTPWEELSEEDQKVWNPYMVHRILSMNPDYLELVDHIQLRSNMPPEMVYKTYCDLLPQGYSYHQYVKGGTKASILKAISSYFEVPKKDAHYILHLLSEEEYDEVMRVSEEKLVESHKIKKSKS